MLARCLVMRTDDDIPGSISFSITEPVPTGCLRNARNQFSRISVMQINVRGPSFAMSQTEIKPIIFSGEFYMGD